MQDRTKRALIIFSIIFIAYFSLLAYAVLFAPALDFKIIGDKLYLKNESSHIIKNIVVTAQDNSVLDCIPELRPSELVRIVLPVEKKITFVIARAPFHREAKRDIVIGESASEAISLEAKQENAVLGRAFKVSLELCNKTKEDFFVNISESHDRSFLKEESKTIIMGIKAQSCKTAVFEYTPVSRGTTTLRFIVYGELFKKEISKNIEIE